MVSITLFEMLSTRNASGGNFFHEVCEVRSLFLLERASQFIGGLIPSILSTRNYNGKQCTHILVNYQDVCAQAMMEILLNLGADINGQEELGGCTPLHLCVTEKNYILAEWLCNAPGINLGATNYAEQTALQLAVERKDFRMIEIVKKAKKKSKVLQVKLRK